MMTHAEVESMVMALPGVYCDYPFGEGVGVYKVREEGRGKREDVADKMFALIAGATESEMRSWAGRTTPRHVRDGAAGLSSQ